MKIKFKKLNNSAIVPSFNCEGDAGMDIYCDSDFVAMPGKIVSISTGISMELQKGYVALIWDRSGLAVKNGIKTMGGVLDSGYRGEIKIIITNFSNEKLEIKKGSRVAQMLIQKYEVPDIEVVEELSGSERGDGGFGSSGV
jgi:dUTP pyrophosphatase